VARRLLSLGLPGGLGQERLHGSSAGGVATFPERQIFGAGEGLVGQGKVFPQPVFPDVTKEGVDFVQQGGPEAEAARQGDVALPGISGGLFGFVDVRAKKGEIGVTKAVDGLLEVPHQKEGVGVGTPQGPDQGVLQGIGILKFVYHDVSEALCRFRVFLQYFGSSGDEVPEDESSPEATPPIPALPTQGGEATKSLPETLFFRRLGGVGRELPGQEHHLFSGVTPGFQPFSQSVFQEFFHLARPIEFFQGVVDRGEKLPHEVSIRSFLSSEAFLEVFQGGPQSGGVLGQQGFHGGDQDALPQLPALPGEGVHHLP